MSTAKERQAKRRAKIKADPELYQAQLLKDREWKKRQLEAQREKNVRTAVTTAPQEYSALAKQLCPNIQVAPESLPPLLNKQK